MKKFLLLFLCITLISCQAAEEPITEQEIQPEENIIELIELNRPENPQIGVNFVRFYFEKGGDTEGDLNYETTYYQPEWIFEDFENLGIQAFRQFPKADFLWDMVEPEDDQWDWEGTEVVITNSNTNPIITVFAMQYASATPPWADSSDEFKTTLGEEAKEYLQALIDKYGDYVTYWELGNEMEHWRAFSPEEEGEYTYKSDNWLEGATPPDEFTPQEQGAFLREAAEFIKERDDDAIIILPGMGGIDDYTLNNWFAGVIEGGGTEWFDIVNYHYYPSWDSYIIARQSLQDFLEEHNIDDKPVWLTETGSTASPTLTDRTDYPNSEITQAADVFRRLIQAYGAGDELVMWHSYIGSSDTPSNNWRLYGLREEDSDPELAYYSFKLLIEELIPFEKVEIIETLLDNGNNIYKISTESDETKYVAWGKTDIIAPEGMTTMANVIPNAEGTFKWEEIIPGEIIELDEIPVLIK